MYRHQQKSPLHFLLDLVALTMLYVAWLVRDDLVASLAVGGFAFAMFGLACCFRSLNIVDQGDHLSVRFGPLGLFGTRIDYRDMTAVEAGQTSFIDGWGIHYIPFRGWTLNIWGFDCVKIQRGNQVIRIGSNDSQNLARYLEQRIQSNREKRRGSGRA